MSEQLHSGIHHPDPDSLNAFLEGVLPEHERRECLEHLAGCPRCREIVFLAQEALPASAASNPVPAWRRWFTPVPVFAAAASVCVIVLAVVLYLRYTAGPPARDIVAGVAPAQAPSTPEVSTEAQASKPVAPNPAPNIQPRSKREPDRAARAKATKETSRPAAHAPVLPGARSAESATTRTVTLAPTPIPAESETVQHQQFSAPPALLSSIPTPPAPPGVDARNDRTQADGLSGISGIVTDASGAAIPGAIIKLQQLSGTISSNARTDLMGRFNLTGLPAGRYEFQITAPGFRQMTKQVDLQPRELAAVNSELAVSSVTEAVEVVAAPSTIQTSAASTASMRRRDKAASPPEPRTLPSKRPATITVARGKVILAVDSAGALFFSGNAGKVWKAVTKLWPGKVVRLVSPAEPPQNSTAAFELTTDSHSVWLSRDGNHWYPAPAQR